jgi:Cof subfamily protein (haloacid dehalogenase superfamily)
MSSAPDIRLLAIDLDGTLLEQGGKVVSAANVEALHLAAEAGVEVVPISARGPASIEHPLQRFTELRLIIAYNGALIYDRQAKKILFDLPMPPAEVRQALQLLLDHNLYISLSIGNDFYVREDCPEARFEASAQGLRAIVEPDLFSLAGRGVHRLLAMDHDAPERLRPFYDQAVRELKTVGTIYTSPVSVEMNHQAVSKGAAVSWLAHKLGFSPAQVMAVGDNYNDISMFSVAGLSVAIGDAPPEVQAKAHWLAPRLSQDGAAAAIWHFILDHRAGEK